MEKRKLTYALVLITLACAMAYYFIADDVTAQIAKASLEDRNAQVDEVACASEIVCEEDYVNFNDEEN